MILTDKFVFIHMPKTGGTFVTSVLERLHQPQTTIPQTLKQRAYRWLGLPPGLTRCRYGKLHNVEPKHGTCHDIPPSHANLPILSCIRAPWEWYVSQFVFGWWKRTFQYDPNGPPTPVGWAIEKALPNFVETKPHFPDVSFSEFMELCGQAAALYNREDGIDAGLYTHGFVRYYYRKLPSALQRPSREIPDHDEGFDVSFLNTSRLNAELERALLNFGYRAKDVAFVRGLGRILPMGIGRDDDQGWEQYYNSELMEVVRRKDRFLFDLFPEFDDSL